MLKYILLFLAITLTAHEWLLLGDSALKLGYSQYATACYIRAIAIQKGVN
jgi:hypothetical protein